MANNSITEQMAVENKMLKSMVEGLRQAIGLKPERDSFARKLHTILFLAQSLQRHLDHLLTLEECDGYMDAVVNLCPQLGRQVDALRQEHDQFRKASRQVVHGLETVAPTKGASKNNVGVGRARLLPSRRTRGSAGASPSRLLEVILGRPLTVVIARIADAQSR